MTYDLIGNHGTVVHSISASTALLFSDIYFDNWKNEMNNFIMSKKKLRSVSSYEIALYMSHSSLMKIQEWFAKIWCR